MVATIDDGDIRLATPQCFYDRNTGEAATDDHNMGSLCSMLLWRQGTFIRRRNAQ
jgi:hypothetical protein